MRDVGVRGRLRPGTAIVSDGSAHGSSRLADGTATSSPSSRVSGDPAGPHQLRQHGAGLLPARRRGGGGAGVPTELNRAAARRRDRPGADLVDRVRAPRRAAAHPAAALRLVGGRGRLDPARLPRAARARALDRGDARERDVGRARPRAPARGRAGAARRGGGRDAPDRRRGAQERVRGPDAALRPRPAVARADRAADGVRGLRLPGPAARRRRRARGRAARLASGARAPSRSGSPARRASATATRPASSPATSRSCATGSARASAPGC